MLSQHLQMGVPAGHHGRMPSIEKHVQLLRRGGCEDFFHV